LKYEAHTPEQELLVQAISAQSSPSKLEERRKQQNNSPLSLM
jgi:hypothetical protein